MTRSALPPPAEMRYSSLEIVGAKTITPSRFHVPPRPDAASQSVTAVPPLASMRCSFWPAKKPSWLLSGDQNG